MCYENDSRERKSEALFLRERERERRKNLLLRERNRVWYNVVGCYIVTSEKKEQCAFLFFLINLFQGQTQLRNVNVCVGCLFGIFIF